MKYIIEDDGTGTVIGEYKTMTEVKKTLRRLKVETKKEGDIWSHFFYDVIEVA